MSVPKEISLGQSVPDSTDAEKAVGVNHVVHETDDNLYMERKDSDNFQGGVQRVRAITSIWSAKTMALTFIL